MGDIYGFLKHDRKTPDHRPVPVRLRDWKEVYEDFPLEDLQTQASRCMDCGIPFCNDGCPLGNIIPDWNDLTYRGHWSQAMDRLHATNNFPDFTGRLCPAPCETACVLGINQPPVTIKEIEKTIVEKAFEDDAMVPQRPTRFTGRSTAVIGSGPAGLAAAQQLTRAGHRVVVYERDDRIGGLLRYGIPEFKMEKWVIDRRLAQMRAEGTEFRRNVNVGVDLTVDELRANCDAVVIATGSTIGRDLPLPGRDLHGIHQAMEFLPLSNRVQQGDLTEAELPISAAGKNVLIIGGGDTGADCLGTVHRQGARSVHQFEIMERPPDERPPEHPWPTWPFTYKVTSAHEEGGERDYSVNTIEFLGDPDGNVRAVRYCQVEQEFVDGRPSFLPIEGTEAELDVELVLLAMGFVGPERNGLLEDLGVEFDTRGNVVRDDGWQSTVPDVFVAGDAGRGQSLIVWAIAEGRACASAVDRHLMGETNLPAPVRPTDRPMS